MGKTTIENGDYIIVQRQGYTKLHKIKASGTLTLAKFLVEMGNAVGEKYQTTFQMKPKSGGRKLYTLEKVNQLSTVCRLSIETSGLDNRNIIDDGNSQALTKNEIDKLRDESLCSTDIVGQLINNSSSFSSKTEYSQEKYMKKKEKKYFEYVQIRKPTIRLLMQMFYRQDPAKTLGIRIDDLSQILTYANVQSEGNFLLYDSGSSGLMAAAVLNAMGADTTGTLIHAHPGNECQKNAILALQFPQEQLDRCINVNLYSVLRCFYQNKNSYANRHTNTEESVTKNDDGEVACEIKETGEGEHNDNQTIKFESAKEVVTASSRKRKLSGDTEESKPKKPCWQADNEKACTLLENKVDSLIITSKEHPVSIVKALVPFLNSSRSLVVFSLLKEPLQDLYVFLKSRTDFISLRLTDNFMRNYQVLSDRTHPEVNMTNGGYILTGFKLSC